MKPELLTTTGLVAAITTTALALIEEHYSSFPYKDCITSVGALSPARSERPPHRVPKRRVISPSSSSPRSTHAAIPDAERTDGDGTLMKRSHLDQSNDDKTNQQTTKNGPGTPKSRSPQLARRSPAIESGTPSGSHSGMSGFRDSSKIPEDLQDKYWQRKIELITDKEKNYHWDDIFKPEEYLVEKREKEAAHAQDVKAKKDRRDRMWHNRIIAKVKFKYDQISKMFPDRSQRLILGTVVVLLLMSITIVPVVMSLDGKQAGLDPKDGVM